MTESVNERGSTSSELGDVEIIENDNELEDQRLRFILNYLSLIFGTTSVAFKKGGEFILNFYFDMNFVCLAILDHEINRKYIELFLDKTDRQLILIFENTDTLNILTEFPEQFKSKLICFIKLNDTIIEKTIPLKKQIMIAEFTQSSLTQLSLFISDVLWPILQRKQTGADWPDMINRSCLQNISELTNLLTIVNGILRGRTILPIPHEIEFLSRSDYLRILNQ